MGNSAKLCHFYSVTRASVVESYKWKLCSFFRDASTTTNMIIQIIIGATVIGAIFVFRKLGSPKLDQSIPGRGPLSSLFNIKSFRKDLLDAIRQKKSKWLRWAIVGQEALIATHPDTAKFVLSNPELFVKVKFPSLSKEQDALYDGHILSANGEKWHQHRAALGAAFHWDAVKGFAEPFYNKTIELMKIFAAEGSKPVDVTDVLPKFTLDVLGVSVFSYDFKAIYGKENEQFKDYYKIINFPFKISNIMRALLAKVFGLPTIGDLNAACVRMHQFCKDILIEKQNQHKEKQSDKTFDIVDMMLKSDAGLSLDEMVANVFMFFFAGHETTASALIWLLYHLAIYPEIQQKVRDEVERVLNGKPLTSEVMRELTYTSHVIKENMRIQPPVTEFATRESVQDSEFEGVFIPKGTRIGIGIEAVHLNEEFWDNPEEFNPNRFENAPKHPFAYMPFSLKSRACIGSQFSLLEQTMFLVTAVQHFKWTLIEINAAAKSMVLNRPTLLRVKFEQIKQF